MGSIFYTPLLSLTVLLGARIMQQRKCSGHKNSLLACPASCVRLQRRLSYLLGTKNKRGFVELSDVFVRVFSDFIKFALILPCANPEAKSTHMHCLALKISANIRETVLGAWDNILHKFCFPTSAHSIFMCAVKSNSRLEETGQLTSRKRLPSYLHGQK